MGITLVLGGRHSGKSRFAEKLAQARPPVTYLATAQAGDAEMAARIAAHRKRRESWSPPWATIEEPWNVVDVVRHCLKSTASGTELIPFYNGHCVLLECLALWLTNLMVGIPGRPGLSDEAILGESAALADTCNVGRGSLIVVSSEVGCGIIPDNALARRFGDLLGEVNQRLAEAATDVYFCVAGIPVRIK